MPAILGPALTWALFLARLSATLNGQTNERPKMKLIRHRLAELVKNLVLAVQNFGAPPMKLIPIPVAVRAKPQARR